LTELRPLRSYGRRKGKPLSARKERLVRDLLPKLHLPLGKQPPGDLRNLFPIPVREVWLEIGFGSGEHLLWQSDHNKDVGFIGCEPFINGVASLLGDIEDRGIKSILIHEGDARDVLVWLPGGSIAKIFLLFPDPWPKKRQQKRRLISSDTIREIARVLAPGGELRFASDDAEYAAQALFAVDGSGSFKSLAESASDWPETRYERKALNEGRKPVYLRWRRL